MHGLNQGATHPHRQNRIFAIAATAVTSLWCVPVSANSTPLISTESPPRSNSVSIVWAAKRGAHASQVSDASNALDIITRCSTSFSHSQTLNKPTRHCNHRHRLTKTPVKLTILYRARLLMESELSLHHSYRNNYIRMSHAGGVLPANSHSPHLDLLKANSVFKHQRTHLTQRLQANRLRWELFHKAASSSSHRRTRWLQQTHDMPYLIWSGSDKRSTWLIVLVVGQANAPTTTLVINSTRWSRTTQDYESTSEKTSQARSGYQSNADSKSAWLNSGTPCILWWDLTPWRAAIYIAVTHRTQSNWRHLFTRTQGSLC